MGLFKKSIVDRNGVPTSRWVARGAETSILGRRIPTPHLATPDNPRGLTYLEIRLERARDIERETGERVTFGLPTEDEKVIIALEDRESDSLTYLEQKLLDEKRSKVKRMYDTLRAKPS